GRATPMFLNGLEQYRDRGDQAGVARCLQGLADLALDTEEPRLAARLLGATDRLPRSQPRGLLSSWLSAGGRRSYEQQCEAARDALGVTEFNVAFAEGQALTPERAAAKAAIL